MPKNSFSDYADPFVKTEPKMPKSLAELSTRRSKKKLSQSNPSSPNKTDPGTLTALAYPPTALQPYKEGAVSELQALRTQLEVTLKYEMERTQQGIKGLEQASTVQIELVRTRLERVCALCKQAEGLFDNFAMIKSVSSKP